MLLVVAAVVRHACQTNAFAFCLAAVQMPAGVVAWASQCESGNLVYRQLDEASEVMSYKPVMITHLSMLRGPDTQLTFRSLQWR
jgi:hypothetical protein